MRDDTERSTTASRNAPRGTLAVLISCAFAVSINADARRPNSEQSKPPSPVTLTVRFAEGRTQFKPGETLPLELEFDSRIPHRFAVDGATYDRSGRLMLDEFRVDLIDDISDPLLDYFALGGGMLGGLRSIGALGEKPYTVKLNLNDWLRFDKPGRYMLSVRSRRVNDELNETATRPSFLLVESIPFSFEILPRDPEWEASEFASSLQILNSTTPGVDRQRACRTLRYLGTDAAVDALIAHLDDEAWPCSFDATAGIVGARDRERAVRQLEAGIRVPDRPISDQYLHMLALLAVLVQHPELRPVQTRENKGRFAQSPDRERLQELIKVAKTTYAAVLDDALPLKSDRVRAMILSWRLEAGRASASSSTSTGSGSSDLRKQFVAVFGQLSVERQYNVLEYQWSSAAGPEMVPVLRAIVDASDLVSTPLRDLALRRLYELAPVEARNRILREIGNPSLGATLKTLGILPDRELPELDSALAANIDIERSGGTFDVRTELLQRYASPAIVGRVLPKVDGLIGRLTCRPQAALLAYFLRADPALGRTLLDRALASREKTGCFRGVLKDVGKLRMTPELEAAAIDHLDDQDAQVVISAIDTLGRYASPAAVQPLRGHFEQWHRAWDGRQEELRYTHAQNHPDSQQGMVEITFLQSLGRAQAWVTNEEELRDLRALCVTDNCRVQADSMIDDARSRRIYVFRIDNPDNDWIRLAQYELTSLAATRQKLAQFPRGTSFRIDAHSIDPDVASRVVSELTKAADQLGITIRREAP